jgi:hypothetical protein
LAFDVVAGMAIFVVVAAEMFCHVAMWVVLGGLRGFLAVGLGVVVLV